jgi:pimeloyl-ACP methyl ester carboxylesterase
VGHWPHRENPSLVIPEVLAFLSQLDSSGS